MGRNAFQRPRADALKLLADVMGIYKQRADSVTTSGAGPAFEGRRAMSLCGPALPWLERSSVGFVIDGFRVS